MTPQEKAERARALLSDVVLQEALDALQASARKQFENSSLGDAEALDAAHRQFWAANEVRAQLRRFLRETTGKKDRET